MTNEMYAANVKNWLTDLATGAKAAQRRVQFADAKKGWEFKVTSSCFDMMKDGVAIHNLTKLAEAIGEPVYFCPFSEREASLKENYAGYDYFNMFGVRFYDYRRKEEV